jgi:hypothetical protein
MTYWMRQWSAWLALPFGLLLVASLLRLASEMLAGGLPHIAGSAVAVGLNALIFGGLVTYAGRRAARARWLAEEGPRRERERQVALAHVERLRREAEQSRQRGDQA